MPLTHAKAQSNHHDRKLALSFGAIVLLLMLTLSSVAGFLFIQLYKKEEDRLSSMLATIFADSVAKVSFSGKYQARLFVEQIQARLPAIDFISVEGKDGKVLAHSHPEKNDEYMQEMEDANLRNLSLKGDTIVSADHIHDGRIIKEVVLPYRSDLDNEIEGVVRIGIKMDEVSKEQHATVIRIVILIIILTLIAMVGILLLSRYFADVHRTLASQLRGILVHAPLPITITNRDGLLVACSNQCERLFGSYVMGQPLEQYLAGQLSHEDIRKLMDANAAIFAGNMSIEQELEITLHGHIQVWYVSKFAIAHDANGRPNLVCTFVHDITERKQAEKNATKAMEQWEKTFNAISDVVTIHDQDMRIVRANKAAGVICQMEPDELIGKFCYEVFCEADDPCVGCPELQAKQDMCNHHAVIRHKKLAKSLEVASFPIIDDGKLSGFVHIAKDITKSLMLEEQLRQSQKMEAIGTLAGGIAHDFNNILTPILGYTEMTLSHIASDSPLKHNLNQIYAAAERAKALVKQILSFSRQGSHEKKPFEPHLIVKEAIKLLRSSLPSTIEFKTNIEQNCGIILADPTQFHQIIMNLCTNAYHAMEATGGTLGISLRRVTIDEDDLKVISAELLPGEYILLIISDTGCGMERKILDRIFEPYFTTKTEGKGTGLGLSVVHGIVKSYHGLISVYSEPGKGSTFHVYLPRMADHPTPDKAVAEKQASPMPLGKGRVLVVDDEDSITGMLSKLLAGLGYEVTVSNDSLNALSMIKAQPSFFDLMITDMTMPHLTGIELAKRVLAINAEMPIILSTGFSELIDKEQVRAAGIKAFLAKPVSMKELAMTLHQLLTEDKNRAQG